MTCDICQDNKRVRLPTYRELDVIGQFDDDGMPSVSDRGWKEFDCPQCTPTVPYRRVRALKVVTSYEAAEFNKYQMPFERGLAARFGEYLLREGLIRFTKSVEDFTRSQVTVTAHLGVVSSGNVEKAGVVEEVAETSAPPIPKKITRQQVERLAKISPRAVSWTPKPAPWTEEAPTEFDEPQDRDPINERFSGLEI